MAFAIDLVVCLVGLGVFGQHIWALRGHFASDRMTRGAQAISAGALASCAILLWLVWSQTQPAAAQFVGIAVMLGSLWLFWAAVRASRAAKLRFAFDDAPPLALVTVGPYRHIRHPFYSSYLIFWAGWAIATWSPWGLLPVIVMTTLYTMAARYEETLLSRTAMGPAYAEYRNTVGLFWPKII